MLGLPTTQFIVFVECSFNIPSQDDDRLDSSHPHISGVVIVDSGLNCAATNDRIIYSYGWMYILYPRLDDNMNSRAAILLTNFVFWISVLEENF